MKKNEKNPIEVDIEYIEFIIENCLDVEYLLNEINYNYDEFINDKRNSLSAGMIVINIGEYANKLSSYIVEENSSFPWSDVIGMRHRFAHNYLGVNYVILWNTLNNDIPLIKEFFEDILSELKNGKK